MTREQAKALLPVIQAWAEGKTVQYRTRGQCISDCCWADQVLPDLNFASESLEWRVKPKPREFIIRKPIASVTTSDVFLYTVGHSTCSEPESNCGYEAIHVREVI